MDEAIGRKPDAPHAHLALTVRTDQGGSPAALLIALAVGKRGNDFDRPFDKALDLGQYLHGKQCNSTLACQRQASIEKWLLQK